jgi:hypothetical protein
MNKHGIFAVEPLLRRFFLCGKRKCATEKKQANSQFHTIINLSFGIEHKDTRYKDSDYKNYLLIIPKRDSANSPLESGLGVCYSLRQGFGCKMQSIFRNFFNCELFGFVVQCKAEALLLFPA